MKRVVPDESLEQWFAEILRPKLDDAVGRGVVRDVQVELLARQMRDLCASRRRP